MSHRPQRCLSQQAYLISAEDAVVCVQTGWRSGRPQPASDTTVGSMMHEATTWPGGVLPSRRGYQRRGGQHGVHHMHVRTDDVAVCVAMLQVAWAAHCLDRSCCIPGERPAHHVHVRARTQRVCSAALQLLWAAHCPSSNRAAGLASAHRLTA